MARRNSYARVLLFVLLFNISKCDQPDREVCERKWDHFKGKCYYPYLYQLYTYDEARRVCVGLDGSLVKISSVEENLFLMGYTQGTKSLWIGANDLQYEGRWRWEDGTLITYNNWAPNEPNNQGNEDCGYMYATSGKWNDVPCTRRYGFICERDILCTVTDVGMESGAITNSRITASCYSNSLSMPYQGRLNFHDVGRYAAWRSGSNYVGRWLNIDLGYNRRVTKVATQGRGDADEWVKSYKLRYIDRYTWRYVTDSSGSTKLFSGNFDRSTIVYHDFFNDAFVAQHVRFYPVTWHRHMSLRVELYACE